MTEFAPDENPLSLDLKSLRASVARFQEEAHTSAVKLQRHSLDAVRVHERAVHLERENDLLKAELAVLRANPHPDSSNSLSDSRTQVQELTLSLRRLSHKISSTEELLLAKTTELVHLQAELLKAKATADNAYDLGARVRGREEAGKNRERDMERRILQLEEGTKMADVVINEYAALVREMDLKSTLRSSESGPTNGYTTNNFDIGAVSPNPKIVANTLHEAKSIHDKLLRQFQTDSEQLHTQLQSVRAELEVANSRLDAEKKANSAIESELGKTRTELEKLHLEDGTAAKMVSRYMQFSQTATNDLLSTLSKLKIRHEGTLSTISSQNYALSNQVRSVEVQNERLRSSLDELGGEIMKETYGRRREVALRIKMSRREERLIEGLRRWVRRGEETVARLGSEDVREEIVQTPELDALLVVVQDARILLESLDEGVFDEETALALSGGKAREFLVNNGLDGLLDELRTETEKRVNLEKRLASTHTQDFEVGNETVVPSTDAKNFEKPLVLMAADSQSRTADMESDDPPQVPDKMRLHSPSPQPPLSPTPLMQISQQIDVQEQDNFTKTLSDDESSPETNEIDSDDRLFTAPLPDDNVILYDNAEASLILEGVVADSNVEDVALPPSNNLSTIVESSMRPPTPPIVETVDFPSLLDDLQEEIQPGSSDILEDASLTPNHISNVIIEDSNSTISIPSALPSDTSMSTAPSSSLPTTPELINPASFPKVEFPGKVPLQQTTDDLKISQPKEIRPHPLLTELTRINKRYDDLQRAFRDCHLALESLQLSLSESKTSSLSADTGLISAGIPTAVLNAAIGRLDDYTEDARVELEIRVGDEVLLAKGYEALLSIPGALALSIASNLEDDHEDITQADVERQVHEFVSGTDPAVRKARELFTRKLEDVQHDIAALKRAIHDPDSFLSLSSPSPPTAEATTPSSSTSNLIFPSTKPDTPTSTGGWSSWIRSSSRPASPAPPTLGPAPTFGNIMTAPRLKHSPSSGNMQQPQQSQRSRRPSFFGLGGGVSELAKDPLAVLELKVPMPSFGPVVPAATSPFGFGGYSGMLSPTSPMAPLIQATPPRARTVSSTMYMLGLGAAGGHGLNARMTRAASTSTQSSGSTSPLGATRQNSQINLGAKQSTHSRDVSKRFEANVEEETDTAEGDSQDEDDTDIE